MCLNLRVSRNMCMRAGERERGGEGAVAHTSLPFCSCTNITSDDPNLKFFRDGWTLNTLFDLRSKHLQYFCLPPRGKAVRNFFPFPFLTVVLRRFCLNVTSSMC